MPIEVGSSARRSRVVDSRIESESQSAVSRVTIGVGGPVGSGKTALLDSLCKRLRDRYSLAVITNDIYTYEDAEFLMRSGALPLERIRGVQTGGCPHTAIREDTSINHEAIDADRGALPRRPDRVSRIRRRQPRRVVQPGAGRRQHLRRRRRRRRQGPAQGRPRRHAQRPARHQQDRSRAARGRRPLGDGRATRPPSARASPSSSPT